MTIGENIRHFRSKLSLTQAQLAEAVGVSVQAVSKWETGVGMPDIAQIIPLARALGVTTDQLLLYEDKKREYKRRWEYALRHSGDDPKQLLAVSQSVLDEDPGNTEFLFRATIDAHRLGTTAEDERKRQFYLSMARSYGEMLVNLDPDHESGKEHMVRVYSDLGMENEAIAMAHQCKNISRALLSCLKGEALRQHRQKRIEKRLSALLNEIDHAGMPEVTEALIRAAIPDGNYQHYIQYFIRHRIDSLRGQIEKGDDDAAMASLWEILALAKDADKTHTDPRFTAPLLDLLNGYPSIQGVPCEIPHEVDMLFFRDGLVIPPHLKDTESYDRLMEEAAACR